MWHFIRLVALAAIPFVACNAGSPPAATSSSPVGVAQAGAAAEPSPTENPMRFDFANADAADAWRIENDGVMGGRSKGFVAADDDALLFTGTLVTAGGGFTSTRVMRAMDLSEFDGVELRVRGGGREYELDVADGTRHRGRQVNRLGAFPTTEQWAVVRVPFDSLSTSAHGDPVDVAPLEKPAVESLGIYIKDGIDGPFRLEVDWIRGYRATQPSE